MCDTTAAQRRQIILLAERMRAVAEETGPLHAWFDIIFDLGAFARGDKTMIEMGAQEWIDYATALLAHKDET